MRLTTAALGPAQRAVAAHTPAHAIDTILLAFIFCGVLMFAAAYVGERMTVGWTSPLQRDPAPRAMRYLAAAALLVVAVPTCLGLLH